MKKISRKDAKAAGLKRYYTGKPCLHGHVCERYVSSNGCSLCLSEREKRLCSENPEYASKRQSSRTARQAARMKKYKADPEYHEWYCKDQRERHQKRLLSDPEYAKARYKNSRSWFKNNPGAARTYAARRRDRTKNAGGDFSVSDVAEILIKQSYKCVNCKTSLRKNYHVDHIMPLSKGGGNGKDNIQCLCPTCNVRKHNKHPIDWAQENGRLL